MSADTAVLGEDVRAGFDRAAPRYDLMVALNPGYHHHLRSAAAALVSRLPKGSHWRLADLGRGSGASTRALLAEADNIDPAGIDPAGIDAGRAGRTVIGVDASTGMLAQARRKVWPDGVSFWHGRAEEVALRRDEWGMDEPLDGVLAAYLFRNVTDRDATLRGVFSVLRPGGTLVTQEYSVAGDPVRGLLWSLVCWLVVIPLSLLTSGRAALYRYLWRSVLDFDSVQVFADRLTDAGFVDVEVRTVPGWQRGILHTFRARKPEETD